MFDLLKNQNKEAETAEKKEKDFIRERDAFNSASNDDPIYVDNQDRKSDLLRWQQEFQEELEVLYRELLSQEKIGGVWVQKKYKEWDENKKVWITKDIPPLCTPSFAEKIIGISVKPWLNKNAVNSNLDEKTIVKKLRNTHNSIVEAVCDGWGVHGIKTIDDANMITRMIKNYTDPAAYRALNGWTKKTDSTMIKRIESQQETAKTQEGNKGILGLFGS